MSNQDLIDPDQNIYAHLANYELASLAESRAKLMDEHSAAFRWLIASLLAVNGGSAIALFGSPQIAPIDKMWSGAAFTVGIFSALLCAYLSQGASRQMMNPIEELAGFWIAVSSGGSFDAERHGILLGNIKKAQTSSIFTRIAGWISATAFIVGVVIIGHAFFELSKAPKRSGLPAAQLHLISFRITEQSLDSR